MFFIINMSQKVLDLMFFFLILNDFRKNIWVSNTNNTFKNTIL